MFSPRPTLPAKSVLAPGSSALCELCASALSSLSYLSTGGASARPVVPRSLPPASADSLHSASKSTFSDTTPPAVGRRSRPAGTPCRCPHQSHSMELALPLFSYSYALSCHAQNPNSFIFNRLRTLCQKHPGWGPVAQALLPVFSPHQSLAQTGVGGSLATIPFRICTYTKPVRNSRRIRTSKTRPLKSFRIRTSKKTPGGRVLIFIPPIPSVTAILGCRLPAFPFFSSRVTDHGTPVTSYPHLRETWRLRDISSPCYSLPTIHCSRSPQNFYPPASDLRHNPAAQGHHPHPTAPTGRIQ
jgi:hypothetical protein